MAVLRMRIVVQEGSMERSFAEEVKQLGLGHWHVLRGEGILAITKALLQSGVSYVGGYPGAPVSHLLDVLADANEPLLKPNMGNTILGYGMGLASSCAVAPAFGKRVVSILGDGGFWHSGLTAGVANAVYSKQDSVLVILENFYTSATGQQSNPSSGKNPRGDAVRMSIADTIKSLGVPWIKVVNPYKLGDTLKVVKEAMTTAAG